MIYMIHVRCENVNKDSWACGVNQRQDLNFEEMLHQQPLTKFERLVKGEYYSPPTTV